MLAMFANLDKNDVMGLIVFACAMAIWIWAIGLGFWSHFASHGEHAEHTEH